MKNNYDVVVVGAGIVGAAIAYNLSQAGIQDVLLLEKNTLCSGDTVRFTTSPFPPKLSD